MSKKQIWVSECDYIGATGVNSVREMAELAKASSVDLEIIDALNLPSDATADDIEGALNELGVRASRVPVAIFHNEVWNDTVTPMAIDGKPGRGYIKALGVNL